LRYRQLGDTGLRVSEIGFGAWGIGGNHDGAVSYGPTDDAESARALRRALELGVTFYDTADLYGYGHSERLLGTVLKEARADVVIATKVGFLGPYGPQDFSVAHLRVSLEKSLRRLDTDYVDLYQLHNPPMELLERDPDVLETLRRFEKEGKVRRLGVSVRSPEDGLAAVRRFGVKAIQVNLNMVDQRAREVGLLEICEREGAGVICRTPLCFGFLSGKYPAASRFQRDDHRAGWSPEQIAVWAEAHRVFAPGEGAAETPAQRALRFCLSYPAVATAIPGMLTPSQVEENVAASDLGPLDDPARRRLEAIYRRERFFLGRGPGVSRA
jgi:aryl-alcohol dehydrogenase-like predicted oxidoreductase